MTDDRIPWAEFLRTAALFGLSPQSFWAMSVREWRLLTGDDAMGALGRPQLQRMMQDFPDEDDHGTR